MTISPDGKQIAYTVPEGNSWSILVAGADAAISNARVLCKACDALYEFSPDGRFLLYGPGVHLNEGPYDKKNSRSGIPVSCFRRSPAA
jgi:Tol biopolymer transport system component